jgi:hypothetical protein
VLPISCHNVSHHLIAAIIQIIHFKLIMGKNGSRSSMPFENVATPIRRSNSLWNTNRPTKTPASSQCQVPAPLCC